MKRDNFIKTLGVFTAGSVIAPHKLLQQQYYNPLILGAARKALCWFGKAVASAVIQEGVTRTWDYFSSSDSSTPRGYVRGSSVAVSYSFPKMPHKFAALPYEKIHPDGRGENLQVAFMIKEHENNPAELVTELPESVIFALCKAAHKLEVLFTETKKAELLKRLLLPTKERALDNNEFKLTTGIYSTLHGRILFEDIIIVRDNQNTPISINGAFEILPSDNNVKIEGFSDVRRFEFNNDDLGFILV